MLARLGEDAVTTISTHTTDPVGPLAAVLLREHHEIDAGIEAFAARAGKLGEQEAPAGLAEWAQPLTNAMCALRRHIYLEEVIVFPKIRLGGLMMAVMVMIREHGEIWRAMDVLEGQLAEIAAAPGQIASGVDRASLIEGCRNMLALLDDHNMKEEPVIYPHLDTDLDPETEQLLTDFLRDGAMPPDWVCEAMHSR